MQVDLPDPLGPITATNSPRSMRQVDPAQRPHGRLARAVNLGHTFELDKGLGFPFPGSLGDHRPGPSVSTTSTVPA